MKKLWLALGGLAIALLIAAGIYYYRHRYVRSDQDLLAILPAGDITRFYANVEALRKSGLLKTLTGTRVTQDKDYARFVREIHFDYSRDLDRVVGAVDGNQLYFLLQGRFDWERLRRYPGDHGGACVNHVCRVPTTQPNRWASFHLIQPDVLALAFSADTAAVNTLQPPANKRPVMAPPEPVWMQPSTRVLTNPGELPLPLRIFAVSVQSATPVILSAGPAAEGTGAAFRLQLDAACANESAAETIRNQLELQTKMLDLELKREHQPPNAADLTGLLTAGSFQIVNQHVIGSWPVRDELLRSLEK